MKRLDKTRLSIIKSISLITGLIVIVLIFIGNFPYESHIPGLKLLADSQASQTVATQNLDIKEWGVNIPLPASISNPYYVVPQGVSLDPDGEPSGIYVTSASLNSSCGDIAIGNTSRSIEKAVGEIVRVLPSATDPVTGELYTQELPNGVTINGYYYGYSSDSDSNTCAPHSALQSINSSFSSSTQNIATESTSNSVD